MAGIRHVEVPGLVVIVGDDTRDLSGGNMVSPTMARDRHSTLKQKFNIAGSF